MKAMKVNRRDFMKLSGMSGTVLALGYYFPSIAQGATVVNLENANVSGTLLNDFIYITSQGKITLVNHRPEMGQGVYQSMPMLLAEELEVDMDQVEIMQSEGDDGKYGHQLVGGSGSVRKSWEPLRKMGAAAREMLIQAAAQEWGVAPSSCYAKNGEVYNASNTKSLGYGSLVEAASKLEAPEEVKLKSKKDFKVLGTPQARQDIVLKTNGVAEFGLDIKVPGMLVASVERSPVFVGKVKSFDDTEALKVPGVKSVMKTKMPVFSSTTEGVAVVADTYWAALQGRKKLKVEWDDEAYADVSNETIFKKFKEESSKDGLVVHEQGDFGTAYESTDKKVEAIYECPFQAHAPMEPMNIVVSVTEGACELWGPIQAPNWMRGALAGALEIPKDKVTINVSFLGGGFGRRAFNDYTLEAAAISKEVGAPVKVIWTREDDTRQGPFRPASLSSLKGGLNDKGELLAFENKAVHQEMGHQWPGADKTKADDLEGAVNPYEVPNVTRRSVPQELHIPVMWWRSVYASTNGFANEAFMDELAQEADKDPIDFRLELLKNEPRYTAVLNKVKEKSGWKKDSKKGYGVAIVESFGSICAQAAILGRDSKGSLVIEKYVAVIDCGMIVNPDTIKAQIEGSIVMGLTAAMKSEITFKNGRAVEQNFDRFKMLRIHECPEIEVHIMDNEEAPGGVGEPGLPPTAPALVNAVFDESGKRIRKLPFDLNKV